MSIDEAFLDLTGTERLHKKSPAETLAGFIRDMEADIGISASVGLAPNKFLAKLASDLEKPRGFSVIGAAEAEDVLAAMPVGRIWGVGKVFQQKLERDGIRTIGQLQEMEATDLARRYGTIGLRLARLSHGDDSREVTPERGAKSVSAETTFFTDISSFDTLRPILRNLAEKVSARLKKAELSGRGVTLKLKTADFKTITRARHFSDPTQLADKIYARVKIFFRSKPMADVSGLSASGSAIWKMRTEPIRETCSTSRPNDGRMRNLPWIAFGTSSERQLSNSASRTQHARRRKPRSRVTSSPPVTRSIQKRFCRLLLRAVGFIVKLQRCHLALDGEIAVVELQVSADAVFIQPE